MTWPLLGVYSCCCGGDLFPFVVRLGAKNRPVFARTDRQVVIVGSHGTAILAQKKGIEVANPLGGHWSPQNRCMHIILP
jgi:hypothetical protein